LGTDTDPWDWLLAKSPSGGWRHVPYQAVDLAKTEDPSLEPRVEVIRRLIAYPGPVFNTVVAAVASLEATHPARWLCYRAQGDNPARPYWLCFVTPSPSGRRFRIGMELYDRGSLGLWVFSGYRPESTPRAILAPFPARPEVTLPRLQLTNENLAEAPLQRWIREAFEDRLEFSSEDASDALTLEDFGWLQSGADSNTGFSAWLDATGIKTPAAPLEPSLPATAVGSICRSIMEIPADTNNALGLRVARARLVVSIPDAKGKPTVVLHPLGRLSNVIGRDPRCDIVIDHPNVSHEHLRVSWRDGLPGVEDLGSKNGTLVDGVPVKEGTPHLLPLEACVEIGQNLRCLYIQDAAYAARGPDGRASKPRHHARVEALVTAKRLTPKESDSVFAEARGRGITPGEVLLDRGTVTLAEWTGEETNTGGCGPAGLALLLLLPLFLLLTGCHSLQLPPIYEQELDPVPMREGSRRVEWDTEVGLRPLVHVRTRKEPARIEAHLLFPFGLYESTPEQSTLRLYPFFQHTRRTDPDGFEDTDTIAFPFVFTGSHPVDGDYLYLFPFGGTLRGLLGKDEAAGVLFPLYGWARNGENESHHVLFPLISWSDGGGQSGFRFLPFFSHQEKYRDDGELVFKRTSILWPFINFASDGTNSRNRFESFFIFPFYGQTRSPWMDDTTILWPFFRWSHDKETGYKEYRVPFPFLIWGEGPDQSRFDLWPLFGFRSRGDYSRHFFLWPIERWEYSETEEYRQAHLWILPFFSSHHREYKDGSGRDLKTTFWPLLRYEERRDGFLEISAIHPLWFDDPLLNFDTLLAPLWTLFRYTRDSEGYEHLNVLFGLYSSRSTPQGEHRWDILGGLVGHTSNPGGDATAPGKTRLFWALEF
jgi:pSer/pThr/pTyr-binding forkhead associated (FHA) protein